MTRTTRLAVLIALGALALVLLLLTALPWWLGWQAEKTYRALLDELAATTGAVTAVRRYDRGWLRSEAESEIRLNGPAPVLVVRLRLDHGPLALEGLAPIMAHVRGELRPTAPAGAAPLASLTVQGTTDLRGTTRLAFAWPAGRLAVAGGALEWQPLRGRLSVERDAQRLEMQLDAPAIHFAGEDGSGWRLEAPQLRAELREAAGGFPLGNITAGAARLVYVPDDVIDGGKLSASARLNGEGLMLAVGAQLQSWKHGEETIGPGELMLEARRIEPSALLPLLRALPALSRPAEAAAAAKLAPLAAMLARKAPEAEIVTLRLRHASGELNGHGRLLFDGRRLGANAPPGRLLTALAGELDLTLPANLVRAWLAPAIRRDLATQRVDGKLTATEVARLAPEAEAHIVAEALPLYLAEHPYARLLVPADGHYRLAVSLKQGRLLINNEPWQCTGMYECRERAGARSDHDAPLSAP